MCYYRGMDECDCPGMKRQIRVLERALLDLYTRIFPSDYEGRSRLHDAFLSAGDDADQPDEKGIL